MTRARPVAPALAAALAAALAWPSPAPASPASDFNPQPERGRFSIYAENDVWGRPRSDNHYTNGVLLRSQFTPSAGWELRPRWLRPGEQFGQYYGFFLGQTLYTPSDIRWTDAALLAADRPYAAWLFAGLSSDWFLPSAPEPWRAQPRPAEAGSFGEPPTPPRTSASHLGLELVLLGAFGPKAQGEAIQSSWHSLMRDISGSDKPVAPLGWKLSYARPTLPFNLRALYETEYLRDLSLLAGTLAPAVGSSLGVRVGWNATADLGWIFDRAGLGATVRLGLMGDVASYPYQGIGTVAVADQRGAAFPLELYLFADAQGYATARNAFLDSEVCSLRTGVEVCGPRTVKKKVLVGNAEWGLVVALRWLEVVYAQRFFGAEFDGGASHSYGRFHVSFVYR